MPASIKHLSAMLAEPAKFKHVTLLAEWSVDKLYYLVELVETNESENKSLVRFEDGTKHWICNLDMHIQFHAQHVDKLDTDEDIFCCVCDDGKSEKPNEIVVCDICQQGYHQECHKPELLSMNLDENEEWTCDTCQHILAQDLVPPSPPEESKPKENKVVKQVKKTPKKSTPKTKIPRRKSRMSNGDFLPPLSPKKSEKKKAIKLEESAKPTNAPKEPATSEFVDELTKESSKESPVKKKKTIKQTTESLPTPA